MKLKAKVVKKFLDFNPAFFFFSFLNQSQHSSKLHFTYRQDDTDKEIVNVENLEISKKNIAVVVPSPRKINMEKISRSPIKNKELTPSNIKTPPRRILHARIQGIVFFRMSLNIYNNWLLLGIRSSTLD